MSEKENRGFSLKGFCVHVKIAEMGSRELKSWDLWDVACEVLAAVLCVHTHELGFCQQDISLKAEKEVEK